MRSGFISFRLSFSNTLVYSTLCCYHECFVCSVCIVPQASNYRIGLSSSSTALNCQKELFSFLFKALFVSLSCSLSFLFFVVVSDTPLSLPSSFSLFPEFPLATSTHAQEKHPIANVALRFRRRCVDISSPNQHHW